MIMNTKTLLGLLLILSFVTACAQATPTTAVPTLQPVVNTPTSAPAYPPPGPVGGTPTVSSPYPGPTSQPTQAIQSAVDQAAIQKVSTTYNLPVDQIKVLSTQPMTWPNGCMGVVIPGVLCTDVIVNGFVVKLEGDGQQFEIHTNQDGTIVVDAAQQIASLSFVVRTPTQSVLAITPSFQLGPTYNPAFNGFLPSGGSISGTGYVIDTYSGKALAVNANGTSELSFIQKPTSGLAIWPGGQGEQPLLAWGTMASGADGTTSLMMANPDGSNLQTLYTISSPGGLPVQLVAEAWSLDGKTLYFSQEPSGIGGYILFGGASNLYTIDVATKQVTEVIPQSSTNQAVICLDAISGDYRYVADHCTKGVITIRDLQAGTSTTIQPPSDFTAFQTMGSARFSPAGTQVAFALAKNDPNAEQGWVAIGERSGGAAKIILTSDSGYYYNVLGWLNDQTVLVQSYNIGTAAGVNQILAVSVDGSTVTTLAEDTFIAVIDNR